MNWLRSALARNTDDSSKRLIAAVSAAVLCIAVLMLAEAISYQAHLHWAIDAALITAFLGVVGFVAAQAIAIYRKPEGEPCPSLKPGESAPPVAALESAATAASSDTQAVS